MKTRNKTFFFLLIIVSVFLVLSNSCKKGDDDNDNSNDTPPSTVGPNATDIDGNLYHSVIIGTQTWMIENLKTTRYRNGDTIQHITDTLWWHQTSGAYCSYDNNESNSVVYGHLYNWYAVNDNRGIAPEGWHIPTFDEFFTLISYLGGYNLAGGKMKEKDTLHWSSPNIGATNESGFTALPCGYCSNSPTYDAFGGLNTSAWIWCNSVDINDPTMGAVIDLSFDYPYVGVNAAWKMYGYSVRCIKD